MKIKFALLLFGLSIAASGYGQQELFLHQSPELWHSNSLNPSAFPKDKRIAIGLPSIGLDATHSGDIGYNDMIRRENGQTQIDFGSLIQELSPENDVYYAHRIETFSVGVRLPLGLRAFIGHSLRLNTDAQYPKALPELLWNGNGPYIGQTLDIAPNVTVFDFQQLGLGLGFSFGNIDVGARFNYLSGVSAIRTDDSRNLATVYTDDDIYQLTINTDYAFHSASLISGIDTSGLGFNIKTEFQDGKIFSENSGSSIDLGVNLRVGSKLTISASALDLGGKINWKANANYFHSNGSYEYEGVTFPGTDIINGSDSLDFNAQLDTLNDIFQFEKTAEEFSTTLPARYYIGGIYDLNNQWRMGLSVFHQANERNPVTAAGMSLRWAPIRWLSVGTMYSLNQSLAANLGFNLQVSPGPVQIYIMSDNLGNAIFPYNYAAVNVRGGLALVF